ncbi:uncharacterized protein B0J16DRAFT_197341 [Fusarium flagelliforme]|uniref:uncharacterized protein n=1 Tax=Fusarium flagelliforme TaxID=2675880 RepID=UPI001E8D2C3D|nr:uncharacterized protein B0J16DRAFT_197341 [Fusarium flagelliforme]KAH7173782.1 hypothetical protein B0J16DRAFT_197341 [Fusarium flagelliforme]
MPTATEFFGITITNFGPLTTTYTPPPSCTAGTTDHLLYAISNATTILHGAPTCDRDPIGDCVPEGSSYDALTTKILNPWDLGFLNYHSPGVHCPKGWTTAAVLENGDGAASEVKSGVFTNTDTQFETPSDPDSPSVLGPNEIWPKLLEPSETLVYCCPSGWTPNVWGVCITSIESLDPAKYTGICVRDYSDSFPDWKAVHTVEGEPVSNTAGVISGVFFTGTWTEKVDKLTDFLEGDSYTSTLVVVKTLPAVALVHHLSDLEATAFSTADVKETETGGSDGEDKTEEVGENGSAASNLSKAAGLAPVVAVLAGFVIGAGLLAPW